MAAMLGKALLMITRPLQPLMPRMTPKLIIIGAQKAGTTTLFDLLSQHPNVIPPAVKEIDFFSSDERYGTGLDSYWKGFPHRPVAPGRHITLEASPSYLMSPVAAERIARHLPQALCLAVLRDPVARAYSARNMYRDFKDDPDFAYLYDPRSFEEAVSDELAGKEERRGRKYLERSKYAPQLERYVTHVGHERLLVKGFGQLKDDPHGLVNHVLERLGLEPFQKAHPAFGTRSNARSYASPISSELKARLHQLFDDDLRRVEELFGRVEGLRDRL